RRWKLGEHVERGLRTQVIVLRKRLDAFAALDVDRHDFLRHPSGLPRSVRELLAAQGIAVLLLAADLVLRRAVLGGRRHRAAAVRVEQPGPERVLELPLAE